MFSLDTSPPSCILDDLLDFRASDNPVFNIDPTVPNMQSRSVVTADHGYPSAEFKCSFHNVGIKNMGAWRLIPC